MKKNISIYLPKFQSMRRFSYLLGFGGIIFFYSCTKDKGPVECGECLSTDVTFSLTIMPIITAKCAIPGCHVANGGNNIPYTSYSEVKAKVGVNNNPLYNRVFVVGDMPQSGSLTCDEKQKIK